MECILCRGKTRVINSRPQKKLRKIWRRRVCLSCGAVFTSSEQIDLEKSILVKDSESKFEPFVPEKLLLSIHDSLKHRKTALADSVALTNTIVYKMFNSLSEPVVSREAIIDLSSGVLKRFDRVSYTHYLAYHPLDKQ